MNKNILAVAGLSALIFSGTSVAEEAAETSAFTVSGDVTMVSDYRWRGLSLSNRDPAIQGSFTLSHDSGVYANVWASSIELQDSPDASVEIDYTLGYGVDLTENVNLNLAFVYYTIPSSELDVDYGEILLDLSVTHTPFDMPAKFNAGIGYTDDIRIYYNANFNNDNEYVYLHTGYSIEVVPNVAMNLHVGHTEYNGNHDAGVDCYVDYSVGVSTTVAGLGLAVDYVGTDLDSSFVDGGSKYIISVSKSF